MCRRSWTASSARKGVPTVRIIIGVLLLWNTACWLVVGGLLAPVLPGGWHAVLLVAVLLLLPVGVLARGLGGAAYPSALTRIVVFRPFWYGQLFLPLLAGAGLVGMLGGLPFGAAARGGRWAIGLMGVVLLALAVWGYAGTRRLVIRSVDAAFPHLPPGLDGVRIAQLSDLHVGPHTSQAHLARVVEAVRAAGPDLIVLTGDQVDDYARDVEPFAASFGSLAAPMGVFAVPGNHDVIAGWDAVRRGMERMGIRVLVNQAVPIERSGGRIWIAGTGDPAGRGWRGGGGGGAVPDVTRTLAAIPPGEFALALAHNPALWPELAVGGVALTLSGHTHYGQLAVPRLRWSVASVFLEHAMGVYRRGGSLLYISPGTNFWGIPLRVGTPPEVTLLTLRRGPGSDATSRAYPAPPLHTP